jgi:hypothetical protein
LRETGKRDLSALSFLSIRPQADLVQQTLAADAVECYLAVILKSKLSEFARR